MLFLKNNLWRNILVITSALTLTVSSIWLLVVNYRSSIHYYSLSEGLISQGMFIIEILLALVILYLALKFKKNLVALFIVLQTGLMIWFEYTCGHAIKPEYSLFVDKFSIIMALIIGIIGGLICVYALGYMKDFHDHLHGEIPDKRPFFFFIIFVFLSAMYGIVFANNLLWLYFFWEITTICSFVLIGYKNNEESRNNAFRALQINLFGGLCFAGAIVYLYLSAGVIELDKLLIMNKWQAMLPVILISLAGFTKSA